MGQRLKWALVLILFCGCQAAKVERSTLQFRDTLLDVYTEQVMDNLVRARTNQPFVQLTFRDLLIQDTDKLGSTPSAGQGITAALGAATEVVTNWAVAGEASREMILSYSADPVVDQNEVYELYLGFANDPSCFQVADGEPDFPVHIMRKRGDCYYYVPCDASHAFQQLVMQTTFLREKKTKDPNAGLFLTRVITRVAPYDGNEEASDTAPLFRVFFDAPVPNSNPTIVFIELNGRRRQFSMRGEQEPLSGTEKQFGGIGATNSLLLEYDSAKANFELDNLKGANALVISVEAPLEETPEDNVYEQRLYDSINRIEANVLKGNR